MVLDELLGYLGTQVATGPVIAITAIAVANPAVVTAANHGLTSGATVSITGSNSTPVIDGIQTVTVIDANTFTVPVNVGSPGTTGSLQNGCGTPGLDLFGVQLPDAALGAITVPDVAAVLNEYGSVAPSTRFGQPGVWREQPRVQVMTRSNPRDPVSGRRRLETIYRTLTAMPMLMTINGIQYYVVRALQSPFWLKVDDRWRHLHVVNLEFVKDPSA